MTLLLQILWTLLAAMTVENLLLPGTLGFSRMLRAARKPEHRAWYAIFVGIFSAISLELSLLIPPQLFPAYANVLRPLCLALCAVGSILGLTVLRKNKKAALAISVVVFIATWLPLMKRFFEVVCRTLGSCRSSDGEPEKDEAACGCAAPAEEDFSCDLDLA